MSLQVVVPESEKPSLNSCLQLVTAFMFLLAQSGNWSSTKISNLLKRISVSLRQ